MTNGEKIENTFPNVEISPDPYSPSVDIYIGGIMMMRVDRNWWNAECEDSADCISKTETLKAMDTLDKFEYTAQYGLERLDKDDTGFVAYVKYEDVLKCIKRV